MTINQTLGKIILAVIVATTCMRCNVKTNTSIEENAISTDKTELGKHINIEFYKPQSVKWIYNETNSESGRFNLQAELHFKKETIEKLMNSYSLLSVTPKAIKKDELGFTWLDTDSKKKLRAKVDSFKKLNENLNDYEVDGYDTYFFKKGGFKGGGFIILDENTILISMFSD